MEQKDDLANGTLEPVAQLAERLTGSRPSPSTVWRHCKRGLRGGQIRLQCVFHGGCWRSTEQAYRRFIAAQTAAAMAAKNRTDDDLDAELSAAGLL